MINPTINIIHQLPGRLRLILSRPPRQIERLKSQVLGHEGINLVKFNPITKSLLIYYNPTDVQVSEIIIRVAISLSMEYGMCPVYIKSKKCTAGFNISDNYALISLGIAWLGKLNMVPINVQNILNYNAAFSTLVSVVNHGIAEGKLSGTPDPEVVSFIYLINSMLKNEFLLSSTITWISTFGRHLVEDDLDDISIQAFKVFNSDEDLTYYDVAVRSENNFTGKSIIRIVTNGMRKYIGFKTSPKKSSLIGQIKNVSKSHGDVLEGLKNKKDVVFLRVEY